MPVYDDRGTGRPFVLLHGGAGPASVTAFADRLAITHPARVITPTHPGFNGTARSATTIRELAEIYAQLLDDLDLSDVTVVGNSIGGWIAAELALLHPARAARFVLVDAVGIEVPDHPIVDFFSLTLPEVTGLSYADPARFAAPPPDPAVMAENRKTLQMYAGTPSMADPSLSSRLAGVKHPVLVVWGEADRIVTVPYGRAYADAIPGAEFRVLANTGHLPQIESPDLLLPLI
jgi:pimeloyl-ACP methyl ester carboxylesterase